MLSTLQQTLRRLAHEPGFTATVLLTLALCIGANVAIYAVVDAILVRPLPFPDSGRLVAVYNSYPLWGVERLGANFGASDVNYYDRRHAIKAFSSVSIYQRGRVIVGDTAAPTRVATMRISPDFFATLGVPLARGRVFTDAEMRYGPDEVAILTDEFWRTHFNADPNILGHKFLNDGLAITIVGVLPPGFQFLSQQAEFFRPASHGPDDIKPDNRHNNNYLMVARLAPGATLADAQAQIDAFNRQQLADDPYAEELRQGGYHTIVAPLHADTVREVRPILVLLQAGVVALLLIGGLNLVNLLLIRAHGRAKEFAVRQALGAGHRHLIREIMLETVLLSLGGGVLGLLLGSFGVELLSRLGADRLPLGRLIDLDARVALVALIASLALGVLLALPVLLFSLHRRLAPVLHSESRSGTVSRTAQRVRHGFIVAQISLAFVLLAGAGLLGISLQKVLGTSPGFRPEQVLTGSIALPWKTYPEPPVCQAFLERLYDTLRVQPGVTSVGFTSDLPFGGLGGNSTFAVEGVRSDKTYVHYVSFAFGNYWQALGIPLVEGRFLEEADLHREQRVCVVDAELARRYWPGQSALGHRIAPGEFTEKDALTIVGVVGNVKQTNLADSSPLGAVYCRYTDTPWSSSNFSVIVRSSLAPEAIAGLLRKAVQSIDPALPVEDIRPMQARIDESLVTRRSPALLAGAFALIALLLAAVGTYGVLAYAVNQRRREIGIRMALGALPQQVLRQFLKLGTTLLLTGVALGVLGAWGAGRAMQSVLFGVGSVHPVVLVGTAATMVIVVLLATLIPSRRATLVSPLEALRHE